jgi:hypothetical protein
MVKPLFIVALVSVFSSSVYADAFEKNLTKKNTVRDQMSPESMFKSEMDACKNIAIRMASSPDSEIGKGLEKNCIEEAQQNYQINLNAIAVMNGAAFQQEAEKRARANSKKDDTAKQLENSEIDKPLRLE